MKKNKPLKCVSDYFFLEKNGICECDSCKQDRLDCVAEPTKRRRFTAEEKAKFHLNKVTKSGVPRKEASSCGVISSLGTRRTYLSAVAVMYRKIEDGSVEKPSKIDLDFGMKYLSFRSREISQKTLDVDRLSLNRVFRLDLPYTLADKGASHASRSYRIDQAERIADALPPEARIAALLCLYSGLRAHEVYTICPIAEQGISRGRDWRREQFEGMPAGRIYTVVGKGGLVRPVKIPNHLAEELETFRVNRSITKTDRGIFYQSFYRLCGGQLLSQIFSVASKKQMGWSRGLHGLRHSYAQNRMRTLMAHGHEYSFCLSIVSRELGHYRSQITLAYLR